MPPFTKASSRNDVLSSPTTSKNPTTKSSSRKATTTITTATSQVVASLPPTKLLSVPFPVETTLTYDAIQHWARTDPHRSALIYTDKTWKVDDGELHNEIKHAPTKDEWKHVTYGDFFQRIQQYRAALHEAGVPLPSPHRPLYRVLILFAPPSRADVLALLIAMQAAGCILMYGTPDAFGGLRPLMETLLKLEPDAVLCSRVVYTVFRSIAMTLSVKSKQNLHWIRSAVVAKAAKLSDDVVTKYSQRSMQELGMNTDTVTTVMFSSGTTGPPTPIHITHRMIAFQAKGYAELLQKHLNNRIFQQFTKISGVVNADSEKIELAVRHGPWISTHIFANFVMLDLTLGGTAVMQPMGMSSPGKTVCAKTLHTIWRRFGTQVTSVPPSLWTRLLQIQQQAAATTSHKTSSTARGDLTKEGTVDTLKLAFLGGAETSTQFTKDLAQAFFGPPDTPKRGGLYRVYGTTQVLPISLATGEILEQDEQIHKKKLCALGYGVCLGPLADDSLSVRIDTQVWRKKGGIKALPTPQDDPSNQIVELGELCVMGQALSPSMKIVSSQSTPPIRIFTSGDVCYIDPVTQHLYFLGRMSQAVDCGESLGIVPAAGVEMVCFETGMVENVAFVGPMQRKVVRPTLVVQLNDNAFAAVGTKECDRIELLLKTLRDALTLSIWSALLDQTQELRVIIYPKSWPVDARHSSKTMRFQLRDWAGKQNFCKFHKL